MMPTKQVNCPNCGKTINIGPYTFTVGCERCKKVFKIVQQKKDNNDTKIFRKKEVTE